MCVSVDIDVTLRVIVCVCVIVCLIVCVISFVTVYVGVCHCVRMCVCVSLRVTLGEIKLLMQVSQKSTNSLNCSKDFMILIKYLINFISTNVAFTYRKELT